MKSRLSLPWCVLASLCLFQESSAQDRGFRPLLNGKDLTGWVTRQGGAADWRVEEGYIAVSGPRDIRTSEAFGPDYDLHVEFLVPVRPAGRGNSGIYLNGRYELQILDPALRPPQVKPEQVCGALYGIAAPSVNACKPAGQWQTFDISFRSPRLEGDRVKTPGRLTVVLNGVKILENIAIERPTPGGIDDSNSERGPIVLQSHNSNVQFRNIQIRLSGDSTVGKDEPRGHEPIPTPPGNRGLRAEYYLDVDLNRLAAVRLDDRPLDIEFARYQAPWKGGAELKPRDGYYENFSVRWTGLLIPRFSEEYTFTLTSNDGSLLWVNEDFVAGAWHGGGKRTWTGRVTLEAGKAVPIRLLYRNEAHGGVVKVVWSSSSQREEAIPADALRPPPPDVPGPLVKVPSLRERIQTVTIALPAAVKHAQRAARVRPSLMMVPAPGNTYRLGWNDTSGDAHITALDGDWRPGKDLVLKQLDLRSLVVHADGSSAALVAELPHKMLLLGLDREGKERFRTTLTGGKGAAFKEKFLDDLWCYTGRLAFNGKEYGVHFAHVWRTEPTVQHQGGYYATLDRDGKVVQENAWTVSHSLDQAIHVHRGRFMTVSVGDAFPNGIWWENRPLQIGKLLYPVRGERYDYNRTFLGGVVSRSSEIGLVFTTRTGRGDSLIYQAIDETGYLLRTVELRVIPPHPETAVKIAPYGQNMLLAWSEGPTRAQVAVLDRFGRQLNEPTAVAEFLPRDHDLIAFPDGSAGWLTARHGEASLKLIRLGR